ncbi:unnamed protein product [Brassica rapa subsp. trilocularis]
MLMGSSFLYGLVVIDLLRDLDRFMVIPDILKHAPMFKRLDARIKAPATGRGTGGRGAVPPVRR